LLAIIGQYLLFIRPSKCITNSPIDNNLIFKTAALQEFTKTDLPPDIYTLYLKDILNLKVKQHKLTESTKTVIGDSGSSPALV